MTQETINIITLVLAIIGTISGITALLFEWYKYHKDRYQIKIDIQPDKKVLNGAPLYDDNKEYILIKVTNIGRRPVKIGNVAFRMLEEDLKKRHYILGDSLLQTVDRILTEENPSTDYLIESHLVDMKTAYYISVFDAFGKEHRKYLKPFRTFWHLYMKIFKGYK